MFKRGFFIFALIFTAILSNCAFAIPKTVAGNLDYDYELVYQSPYPNVLNPGETIPISLKIKNTGSETWGNTGNKIVRLGSGSQYGSLAQRRDYNSEFSASDWLSKNRPVTISNTEVKPGEETDFQFNIKAPSTSGVYRAYFTPVVDGVAWMKDIGIYWQITVQGDNSEISALTENNQDNILDALAPSIVKIICKNSKDYWNQGSGTLFHNSDHSNNLPEYYVATNLHIVRSENNPTPECEIRITPDYKNKDRFIIFQSNGYKSYDSLDFAILEPKNISNEELAKYAKEDKEMADDGLVHKNIGEDVFVLGYPKDGDLTVSGGDIIGYETHEGSKYIDASTLLYHGNSGGLAINSYGEILGIPTFIRGGVGMILDMDYIADKIY